MDRLSELEVFVRVVESESFTGAAEKLEMSRAMVSKYVIALEKRLGVRLLNRTTRQLSLTEPGRIFYQQCSGILSELQVAEAQVTEAANEPRGTLRINAPMSFGTRHLGGLIKEFLDIHPYLSIDLDLNDRVVGLVDEGYDMAIRIGELADSSLVARKIAPIRIVVCASPDYLQQAGHPGEPADLADHAGLLYSYDSARDGWRFARGGEQVRVKVKGRFRANNGDVIREAALSGLGLAILPTFIAGDDLAAGRLVRLLPDWSVDSLNCYAVYPETRFVTGKVRQFIDFLVKRFGPLPPWDRFGRER